jgi:hypothetical protein
MLSTHMAGRMPLPYRSTYLSVQALPALRSHVDNEDAQLDVQSPVSVSLLSKRPRPAQASDELHETAWLSTVTQVDDKFVAAVVKL